VVIFPLSSDSNGATQLRPSDGFTYSYTIADTPGAGAASYSWQYKSFLPGNSPNLRFLTPFVQAVEIKR